MMDFKWKGTLHSPYETDDWDKDSFFQITIDLFNDDIFVGYITFIRNFYKTEIKYIKIFKEYRRKGYGTELIKQLISKNVPDGLHHKYDNINWGYTTISGTKLKNKLDILFKDDLC